MTERRRLGRILVSLAVVLGLGGCASKRQAAAPPVAQTGNPIVDTAKGAGRSIVNGTKAAGRGIKSWVDPSASAAKPEPALDDDRSASRSPNEDRTSVAGDIDIDDDGPTSKGATKSKSSSRPTTRVSSRDLDVPVVDELEIE